MEKLFLRFYMNFGVPAKYLTKGFGVNSSLCGELEWMKSAKVRAMRAKDRGHVPISP
jgi:hypothetical protein